MQPTDGGAGKEPCERMVVPTGNKLNRMDWIRCVGRRLGRFRRHVGAPRYKE